MVVPQQFSLNPDITIAPVENWGYFIPRSHVEYQLPRVMRNILADNWTTLGYCGYFILKPVLNFQETNEFLEF